MQKLNQEQFIKKARNIHGDKYDYSKLKYVKAISKVIIICKYHGEFLQTPDKHSHGRGCPRCAIEIRAKSKTKTLNEFIKEAQTKHKNKYNYSKVNYINNMTKIIIICPEHGEFLQFAANHLQGKGCPICVGKNKTTASFIQEAYLIHKNKYDYSITNYIKGFYVEILCKIHGKFKQAPSSHLQGRGCPSCGQEYRTKKATKSFNNFIKEAVNIHGDKYIYLNDYKNAKTKMSIVCKIHGEFKQAPSNHLQGRGCLKCGGSFSKTTDIFIKEAINIHGNKYNYYKVNYINDRLKIKIICLKHGEFFQAPGSHLKGSGCPKCVNKNETKTGEILTELLPNISLKRQLSWGKLFNNSHSKRKIDFYFEKDGQKYIVEYNGGQHYFPVKFGKMTLDQAEKQFSKQQQRDRQLKDLCDQHNINLIEIDGREYTGSKIKDYLIKCFSS